SLRIVGSSTLLGGRHQWIGGARTSWVCTVLHRPHWTTESRKRMSTYEVMSQSDRDGWVCVVRRFTDQEGHEFIPMVAELRDEYADLADEMATRLNVREMSTSDTR